ncbi:hypothetical protein Sj15T_32170 [Sphingobium sp. TA15]|uniref:Lipoprotein n=1 Tax=Sphingobium indicum (strain DSM 16413 / CCM 7287 / MTCC 6362 / UT26 / NBRC 101211 / UT26S) TaxID=452662 RepID=D4YYI4_SPHIU|nr:hypothetical protein [Sphingobium indicum]BAI95416.1 hypothetical protein SJA_C1-05820 [Sphingobium indicum UT26S]BDD68196.1 hypothetical protein Sj15T_32170 [Sphingobium sp. TA15]
MRFTLPSAMPTAAFVLLASCVGAPQQRAPAPAPAPRPTPAARPAPPPPPPADWQDRATTAGDWRYQVDGAGSAALFGADGQSSLLIIRCDRPTRRITLLRPGAVQAAMTVRTSYGAVNWPAGAAPGTIAATEATRAASDATLDQIAYSRGRFAVEVQGLEMLVLPSWAEVGRVVEDCRG